MEKLINNMSLLNLFLTLKERWDDEWKYEDFNVYVQAMRKKITSIIGDIESVCGTESPFGIKFTYDNVRYHLILKNKGNGYYCLAY